MTGGAGFIGSHIVDAYLRRGDEVIVIVSLVHGREANVAPGAELYKYDIRDEKAAALIRSWRPNLISHHAAQMDIRVSVADPPTSDSMWL